jgi:hypothetical protein
MHFSPVNKTMCPLECAALTSQTHRTVVPSRENQSSSASKTIFYPHFGQRTGTKRASNWYSRRTQKSNFNLHFFVHTLFCPATTTVPTFTFFTREQDRCVRSSAQHLLVIGRAFGRARAFGGLLFGLSFVLLENSHKSAAPHQSRKEPTTQTHHGGRRWRTILLPSPERLRYHATNEPQQPPPLWSVFNALSLLPATAAGRPETMRTSSMCGSLLVHSLSQSSRQTNNPSTTSTLCYLLPTLKSSQPRLSCSTVQPLQSFRSELVEHVGQIASPSSDNLSQL